MFIIFEGCDLVGKTSIAKELEKQSDFKYFKYLDLKKKFKDDWMKYVDVVAETEYNALKQFQDSNMILDRSFISSIIYEKLYQREYNTDYINFNDFKNAMIIYVYLDDDKLMNRINERTEDEIILKRILDLNNEYKKFFDTFKGIVLKLDGSKPILENVKQIQFALYY